MYFLVLSVTLLVVIAVSIYFWWQAKRVYWQKRHIISEPATLHYLGRGIHLAYYLQDIYKRFSECGQPFVGIFIALAPSILLLDLDLIKSVFIGNFESFPDRGLYYNPHDDPLSLNLLRLEGEEWKRLRAKLTPTFSSGRMKFMFSTVVAISECFTQLLHDLTQQQDELEMRELCARYTTDVIGSVAFGIDCNSLREPHTEFRKRGDEAFATFDPIFEAFATKFPKLFRKLHVRVFSKKLIKFYSTIVKENVAYREANNIRRNDFLDILIELKNSNISNDQTLTMDEIIGQAFVFFTGGFETSSATMSYCLYELCKNPEMQEKARKEIFDTLVKHNNEFSYECFRDMRYMEQLILETLRKYPIAPTLKRFTAKDYHVPNTSFTIEKGTQVIIPVYAIQHNPLYYPVPEKFDPERFSATEIQKRPSMTYLPFGAGPRVCIAERFGKMQALIGLIMLLKHFKFAATENTQDFLEFNVRDARIFSVVNGIRMKLEKV